MSKKNKNAQTEDNAETKTEESQFNALSPAIAPSDTESSEQEEEKRRSAIGAAVIGSVLSRAGVDISQSNLQARMWTQLLSMHSHVDPQSENASDLPEKADTKEDNERDD